MRVRATALAAVLLLAHAAAAQWPERTVTIVVPSAAGTSADVAVRALAAALAPRWNRAVVVENKPGGGATLATHAVARAAPDGHTLLWVIAAHATNPTLRPRLPYDTVKDFSGVTPVYQLRPVIIVAPGHEAGTVDELIAHARRHPGQFYTSAGVGTGPHLLAELFRQKYRLDLQHVPHKSSPAAHLDVMAGRIGVMFDTLPNALPLIRQGKVKVLAVIGEEGVPEAPALPVLRGLLPREAIVGWNGIVVPSGTPRPLVHRIHADVVEAMGSPAVQAVFATLGVSTLASTPEAFDDFIRADIARWAEVIRHAGIKLE